MEIHVPRRRTRAANWVSPPALRALHGHCGAIFAPTLLFFALSGMLQVFDLHKPRAWQGRDPPVAIRVLASLHKDQRLAAQTRAAPGSGLKLKRPGMDGDHEAGHERRPPTGETLLKLYVAAASAALAVSTVAGLVIAWRDRRRRARLAGLVAAGVLVPLALALLSSAG